MKPVNIFRFIIKVQQTSLGEGERERERKEWKEEEWMNEWMKNYKRHKLWFLIAYQIQGTVEDRILELQEKKKKLAEGVLNKNQIFTRLTVDDLVQLFSS